MALNNDATGFNGEPNSFSLGRESMGGFGVASDNYSFLDQSPDELSAKGNGGMRQLYNYATLDLVDKIETPPDNYSPDKVGSVSLEQLQQKRNLDIQQPSNAGNHIISGGGGGNFGSYVGPGARTENVGFRTGTSVEGINYNGLGGGAMGGDGSGMSTGGSQRGQSMPQPQQYAPVGTPPQFAAQAVYRAPPQQPEYSRLAAGGGGGGGGGGANLRGSMDMRAQPRGGGSWI